MILKTISVLPAPHIKKKRSTPQHCKMSNINSFDLIIYLYYIIFIRITVIIIIIMSQCATLFTVTQALM